MTDPDELALWWGPQGFTVPSVEFEPRVGASYRIAMQPPEGETFHLEGEVRVVDLHRQLAYTFRWDPPIPKTEKRWLRSPSATTGTGIGVELHPG